MSPGLLSSLGISSEAALPCVHFWSMRAFWVGGNRLIIPGGHNHYPSQPRIDHLLATVTHPDAEPPFPRVSPSPRIRSMVRRNPHPAVHVLGSKCLDVGPIRTISAAKSRSRSFNCGRRIECCARKTKASERIRLEEKSSK